MIAQPKGAAPVSRDVVEVVKRKMAAPARPPPAGMTLNFNAPKNITSGSKGDISSSRYDEYDNPYDDDDYNDDGIDEDGIDEDADDGYYSEDSRGANNRYDYQDIYHEGEEGDGSPRTDSLRRSSKYVVDASTAGNSRGERKRDPSRATDLVQTSSANPSAQPKQGFGELVSSSSNKPTQQVSDAKSSAPLGGEAPAGSPAEVVTHYLKAARLSGLKFNYVPILKATYRELKNFATSPCTPGTTTLCYIERNRSGTKRLAPYYSVCADLEDGTGRQLMVCRKVMRSRSPHYVFSLKAEDLWRKREQRSRLYLGKLRATSSNSYVLYDNGICEAPVEDDSFFESRELGIDASSSQEKDSSSLARKSERDKKGPGSSSDDMSLYRSELMALQFNSKARPTPPGKRGTEVCIPCSSVSADQKAKLPNAYCIEGPFNKVRTELRQNSMYAQSCFFLHEKTSRYDPLSSCLVDFKGRANMASIKNVQFVVSEPLSEVTSQSSQDAQLKMDGDKDFVLQLGKTTEDCFNMDFRYPLSLLQAFAICVARFDAKLTW